MDKDVKDSNFLKKIFEEYRVYLSIGYVFFEFALFLAAFALLVIMTHEGVVLFTIDAIIIFIIVNMSARMAMVFESYHIFLLFLVSNSSKFSVYILLYHFVRKYFHPNILKNQWNILPSLNFDFRPFFFGIVIIDIVVSLILLYLYFDGITERHIDIKIRIRINGDSKDRKIDNGLNEDSKDREIDNGLNGDSKDREIFISIVEKSDREEKETFLDHFKVYRKKFNKYILVANKGNDKLILGHKYYRMILLCSHLNLLICDLLIIEWCFWWAFEIYHVDEWLLIYSIPWSLLLPTINIFTMLKGSRTASKICLFLHYFVSILQILYCFCRIYNYYTLAKVIQPKIFYLILLLGMALFLTSLTLILPCAAAVHLFQNSIFFEGLEELQKHINYSPSDEYDPKHPYDFSKNVYKKYEDEKRWI
ncbi:hypothetical protein RhiirA5_402171 [Rhizophagus irregularis]|uniref:Transmembrane protein n=1 Tax=Rhizophagus irregularis TaxID=588596 RepID=A0A2N0P7Z1_9GLOM|nr:hypothetical protein RhiirA5_402171 [Rhizophagus irregularis]